MSRLNRRAILAGAAAAAIPATAAVAAQARWREPRVVELAVAPQPDPIFAAIAECRDAILAWDEANRCRFRKLDPSVPVM